MRRARFASTCRPKSSQVVVHPPGRVLHYSDTHDKLHSTAGRACVPPALLSCRAKDDWRLDRLVRSWWICMHACTHARR